MKHKSQHEQMHNIIHMLFLYKLVYLNMIFNYIYTFGLTEGKNPSVARERLQDSVNSTGYCSSIYRHMMQPVRNYIHALYKGLQS
jgi:hypothetical protein